MSTEGHRRPRTSVKSSLDHAISFPLVKRLQSIYRQNKYTAVKTSICPSLCFKRRLAYWQTRHWLKGLFRLHISVHDVKRLASKHSSAIGWNKSMIYWDVFATHSTGNTPSQRSTLPSTVTTSLTNFLLFPYLWPIRQIRRVTFYSKEITSAIVMCFCWGRRLPQHRHSSVIFWQAVHKTLPWPVYRKITTSEYVCGLSSQCGAAPQWGQRQRS